MTAAKTPYPAPIAPKNDKMTITKPKPMRIDKNTRIPIGAPGGGMRRSWADRSNDRALKIPNASPRWLWSIDDSTGESESRIWAKRRTSIDPQKGQAGTLALTEGLRIPTLTGFPTLTNGKRLVFIALQLA
jgi:hypothetical protein